MECETFQQQALFVPDPDGNFDPNAEPRDGEEYLLKVIHERKRCPTIVVKPIKGKRNSEDADKSSSMQFQDEIVDSSKYLHPTESWRVQQLQDFIAVRRKISNLREHLNIHGCPTDNQIPLTAEQEKWEVFCRHNQPHLSTILRIEQRSLEKLLEFLADWFDNLKEEDHVDLTSSHKWLGMWTHSVLGCLHLPLEAPVHSALREIAKTCVYLRNKLNRDDVEKAVPLNLLTVLTSRYFRQLDLGNYV